MAEQRVSCMCVCNFAEKTRELWKIVMSPRHAQHQVSVWSERKSCGFGFVDFVVITKKKIFSSVFKRKFCYKLQPRRIPASKEQTTASANQCHTRPSRHPAVWCFHRVVSILFCQKILFQTNFLDRRAKMRFESLVSFCFSLHLMSVLWLVFAKNQEMFCVFQHKAEPQGHNSTRVATVLYLHQRTRWANQSWAQTPDHSLQVPRVAGVFLDGTPEWTRKREGSNMLGALGWRETTLVGTAQQTKKNEDCLSRQRVCFLRFWKIRARRDLLNVTSLVSGLETEGIFRRSANANVLKQVQKQFNEGKTVDFQVSFKPFSTGLYVKFLSIIVDLDLDICSTTADNLEFCVREPREHQKMTMETEWNFKTKM